MKDTNLRGRLTDEIKNKYDISLTELGLMPYLQYLLINHMPVDPAKLHCGERETLQKWRDEGKITFSLQEPCTITKEFWNFINNVLFDSYIPELCED